MLRTPDVLVSTRTPNRSVSVRDTSATFTSSNTCGITEALRRLMIF